MSNFEDDDFLNAKRYRDFTDTSALSPRVRRHLVNTYSHLALTVLAAMLACWMEMRGMVRGGGGNGVLAAVGGVGLLYGMRAVQMAPLRQGMLYAFGFLEGLVLAPSINTLYYLDPQVLFSALGSTAAIFLMFTLSALFTQRRSYFYLAGMVGSGFVVMLVGSLVNAFLGSSLMDSALLYLGLLVFAFLVALDTQGMVERVEARPQGSDAVMDAANMLTNIVAILRRLMIILTRQSSSNNDRRKRQRRRE